LQIVYLESEGSPDLVVLSPRWLCVDIMGTLMAHDKISQARVTGCFTVDEFQLMFPDIDSGCLLQVGHTLIDLID
jgi:death-associated protein kinase